MLYPVHQAADLARQYFKDSPNVFVVDDIPIDDGWTRDWGPTVCSVGVVDVLHPCISDCEIDALNLSSLSQILIEDDETVSGSPGTTFTFRPALAGLLLLV